MNERDKELAAEAEEYADRDFKGEVYWREAYEAKLIDLIRADEREKVVKFIQDYPRWLGDNAIREITEAILAMGDK